MNRRVLAALAVAASVLIAGCGNVRDTRTKVIEVDGVKFLCSYTHNNMNGNESEQVCVPFNPEK